MMCLPPRRGVLLKPYGEGLARQHDGHDDTRDVRVVVNTVKQGAAGAGGENSDIGAAVVHGGPAHAGVGVENVCRGNGDGIVAAVG